MTEEKEKITSGSGLEKILTVEQTMELLSISRHTFDRFRKEGIIKVYRLKRRLYTKYSEIMETLENGLQDAA